MNKFIFCIFLTITLFVYANSFAQAGVWRLNDKQKQFIAAKVSKIQADMNDLKRIHNMFQQDTITGYDRRNIIREYNGIGINCFRLNPDAKSQTYDIETEKIQIDGIPDTNFSIFHSFHIDLGEQYFVAVDDSGYVFLLNGFWTDEFTKLIRKKIGMIDNSSKANDVVKIFIHTKLYSPHERKKIIIDKNNVESFRSQYPYLKPVQISRTENDIYNISLYTISPYSEEVIHFDFQVYRTGELAYKTSVKNESKVRD